MSGLKDVALFRETIRVIIRNLGALEKDETPCCGVTMEKCHAIVEIGRRYSNRACKCLHQVGYKGAAWHKGAPAG